MSNQDYSELKNKLQKPEEMISQINENTLANYQKNGNLSTGIRGPEEEHEYKLVEQFRSQINVGDSIQTIKFGTEAQTSLTKFADKLLSEVKLKDFGEAGEAIKSISKEIASLDESKNQPTFLQSLLRPILGSNLSNMVKEKMQDRMDTAKDSIDRLVENLVIQNHHLSKDVYNLNNLYNENKKLVRQLELYIFAGLEEMPTIYKSLAKLQEIAKETGDISDGQNYADMYKAVDRFEKRINNLKRARLAAIQGATQIRLTEGTNTMLIEDINDVIDNVIPAWKRQFVQSISIDRQKTANEIVKVSKDSANLLYRKNADNMDQLVMEVGKGYARGIYDIESMQVVNASTIGTLKKTLSIHKEAKEAREKSEIELVKMEDELRQALIEASNDYKNL